MLTTATAPRYLTPPPIQVASEMPRGLGARFFRNQFQITDEELREDARITAVQGDTQWDEYLLQTISQDCAFFAREILNGPPEAPYNGHFMLGPHLLEWSELVRKSKRLAVLAPRDHGKTYFFDFAYPIWKAIKLPNGSGFIFSATQDQAVRILGDIKQELETNPKLQYLVPDTSMGGKGKKWSSTAVQLNNGHRIYARGFGTRVRGAHPHWIVVDDALNDETAYSEVVRKKQIEYFYTAVSNMCIPGGQIVVVGCVIPDTWVTTSGGLRRIGDLCPASDPKAQTLWPLTLQVAGRSGFQETSHYWVNGVCPTKRLTLQRGFTLEGSHRHPVLMMPESGIPEWRKLPDIRVGDYVAVRVGLDAWGPDIDLRPFKTRERGNQRYRNSLQLPDTVTAELSYLLGLWTAEGSYETTGRVAIANTEKPIRDFLLSWPLGMRFSVSTHLADQHVLRVSSKEFLELITFLGGKLGRCHQKIIPEKIMRGPKYVVQAFLQGLYDGGGNACATTPNSVTLGTTSEVLADQVQQLLLNFGVLSTRRMRPPQPTQRCPGASLPLWVVVAVASEAKAFGQLVGFKLARKQKICDEFPASIAVDQRAIPHRRALIATMREEKPRIPRNTQAKFRGNIAGLAACATISTERCRDILNWFVRHGAKGSATEAFRATLVEGLAWLPVKQIADRESPTVDFVVPVGHSFVSNGIVSHNTPFHQADLYADLSANEEYLFKRYQALQGAEETPLWPGRYDKERLEAKRREIGTIRFTREFQCEPVADDMSLFPLALFKGAPTEVFTLTLGMAKEIYERLGVTIFMGVDFAMSSSAQADYTVIWVMGVDKWGNRWIIDIQRGKGLPYQTQLSMINELGHKYDPALVFLEANQMQRIFGDELIRTTDLPIKQFVTGAQKNTLDKGVPSLRVLLENGKFRIPRGDKRSIELTNIWIEEMRAFTWVEGALKSVGTHDDTVMGCWICDQAVRAGGFSFDFGEDIGTSGNLDKMLQDENAETNETAVPTPEAEIEGRIREALGMELEAPKSSGNLIDDEMGDPFGDSIDESKQTGGPITKGNLVDDAEMDEAEMRRKLLGGAPSAARIRSYW
jgi:hypothetical protein